MANEQDRPPTSFLGTGWSFPPEFVKESGSVSMTSDEADVEASLRVLFRTARGERLFNSGYGLDMQEMLFEPVSTTTRTFLTDRVKTNLLLYEPRIRVISLQIDSPDPNDGTLRVALEYEIRATNSRYNLVFPFYRTDSNEVWESVDRSGSRRP